MILQALAGYYQTLLEDRDSGVASPGYSSSKVSHTFVLSIQGELLEIVPMFIEEKKKKYPRTMILPQEVQRSSNINPNFLYDNVSYILGVSSKKEGRETIFFVSQDKFKAFRDKQEEILRFVKDEKVKAFLEFLKKWVPEKWDENSLVHENMNELVDGNHIVFRVEGLNGYLHECKEALNRFDEGKDVPLNGFQSQCLITGEHASISKTHTLVKGVRGSQSSGAAIVSFNIASFKSYGKDQSYNAPVSEKATFAYTTALNYLLNSNTNHLSFADTTMVFWAEREEKSKNEELVLTWSLDSFDPDKKDREDDKKEYSIDLTSARQARDILENVRNGLPIHSKDFHPDAKCYLLGLAPNAARISVRFWKTNSFGEILNKIALHYNDINIIGSERFGTYIPPWRILKEVATLGKSENIPPLLGGQLVNTILSGTLYPYSLYSSALSRVKKHKRDERDEPANPISVGIIKAYLLRKYRLHNEKEKEEMITVGLNASSTNHAYRMGRLFSLLEKAQKDAIGKSINAGISDKYFSSASATPVSVFPILLRLYRHHKSKLQKEGKGFYIDQQIQEVLSELNSFPTHLNLEDQGLFVLGYYHQNQANYTKVEKEEVTNNE